VATVAGTLEVDACGVLKLREDEELLDILAKLGYEGPDTGLPAGTGTHSGYALKTHRPVVVADVSKSRRFNASVPRRTRSTGPSVVRFSDVIRKSIPHDVIGPLGGRLSQHPSSRRRSAKGHPLWGPILGGWSLVVHVA
jgi:hypothetical protein